MDTPKTLLEAITYFSDYDNCRKFMVAVRWADEVVRCPHCGNDKVTYLEKARLYFCPTKHPKQKFSLKVGTIFEDSPIGLDKWLPAAWLIANCRNGISSYEIARALGVTQKSAWHMAHRLRVAMAGGSSKKLGGSNGEVVEIDEVYIGGDLKNKHLKVRKVPRFIENEKRQMVPNSKFKNRQGRATEKVPVFGIIDRTTRQVRTQVLPGVKREVLMDAILENIETGSTIYSDGLTEYKSLKTMNFIHETVNHLNEYVRGEVHTQGIENYWALLKRGLKGTYIAVEPFHLHRYADEQAFRYNNSVRKTDGDRFKKLLSQIVGKRLTFADLTGKEAGEAF